MQKFGPKTAKFSPIAETSLAELLRLQATQLKPIATGATRGGLQVAMHRNCHLSSFLYRAYNLTGDENWKNLLVSLLIATSNYIIICG